MALTTEHLEHVGVDGSNTYRQLKPEYTDSEWLGVRNHIPLISRSATVDVIFRKRQWRGTKEQISFVTL